MRFQVSGSRPFWGMLRKSVAFICSVLLTPGDLSFVTPTLLSAQDQAAAAKIPAEQLDSLVAPIALYADPLLSQVLVACTYPLEIVQLQQWLGKNKTLKDKALADAVKKQEWDASIQALAPLPDGTPPPGGHAGRLQATRPPVLPATPRQLSDACVWPPHHAQEATGPQAAPQQLVGLARRRLPATPR